MRGKQKHLRNRAKRIITPLWGTTEWGKKEVNGDIYFRHTLFYTITLLSYGKLLLLRNDGRQ